MARLPRPRLGRLRRRTVAGAALVAILLVAGVVAIGLAAGDEATAAVDEEEVSVEVGPEPDGTQVELDVSVFTPEAGTPGADADGRRAAVLLAHGFGGSKDDNEGLARDLAAEGYVALTWTARGFGDSGGLIHLDSPDYEVADVSVLLDRLAERGDVRLDGDGDPVVGMAGGSYGGAVSLMAAGYDQRVDAIVPAITWHDLGEALFPQNAVRDGDGGDTGRRRVQAALGLAVRLRGTGRRRGGRGTRRRRHPRGRPAAPGGGPGAGVRALRRGRVPPVRLGGRDRPPRRRDPGAAPPVVARARPGPDRGADAARAGRPGLAVRPRPGRRQRAGHRRRRHRGRGALDRRRPRRRRIDAGGDRPHRPRAGLVRPPPARRPGPRPVVHAGAAGAPPRRRRPHAAPRSRLRRARRGVPAARGRDTAGASPRRAGSPRPSPACRGPAPRSAPRPPSGAGPRSVWRPCPARPRSSTASRSRRPSRSRASRGSRCR